MDKRLGGIITEGLPHYIVNGHTARRVIYYHDEFMWECDTEIAEDILQCGIDSIKEAAIIMGIRVPIGADGKIGMNWKEIH